MSKLLEYLRLCRLCLVKDNVNVPIFADSSDVRQIFLKISACLPVKVSQDDNLPKHICDNCLYKVDLLYQFWNTTVNSEKQLIEWFTELGIDVNIKNKDSSVHMIPQSHAHPHSMPETIILKEEHQDVESQQNIYSGFEITPELAYQPQVNMTVGAPTDFTQSSDTTLEEDIKISEAQAPKTDISRGKRRGRPPKQKITAKRDTLSPVITSTDNKKRSSAIRAASIVSASIANLSSDDSDIDDKHAGDNSEEEDFDTTITKEEADSDDEEYVDSPDALEPTTFVDVPSSTCDMEQPGPSGLVGGGTTIKTTALPANTTKESGSEEKGSKNTLLKDLLLGTEYRCKTCYKTFATNSRLLRHTTTHIVDNPKPSCIYCTKIFQNYIYLKKHIKMYHDNNESYKCKVCDREFKIKGSFIQHMNRYTSENDISCPLCNKKFHHENDMRVHYTIEKSEGLACYECSEKFNSPDALQYHAIESHGSADCRFRCKLCSKPMACYQSMMRHVKSRHLGISVYVCEVCGKKLSSRASLRDHMLFHRGEKPITCEQCGKTFAKRNTLNVHLRTHTGVKPYTCETCGKSFTQISTLTIHKRKHTGDRPYPCNLCSQKFISKTCLKLHQQSRHKLLTSSSNEKKCFS